MSQMTKWSPKATVAGVVFVIALCIPGITLLSAWHSQHSQKLRWDNDRAALGLLSTLRSAELTLKNGDLDDNGVKDYWTGDVAGLHKYGLITREMAEADAHPLAPLVPLPVPYHGYLVAALVQDDGSTPPEPYSQETDAKSGKVHHRTKYAFCIYPAEPGVTGNYIYITHESYSGYSCPAKGRTIPTSFPKDDGGMLQWNRCLGGG
jgi:hypothetical protein